MADGAVRGVATGVGIGVAMMGGLWLVYTAGRTNGEADALARGVAATTSAQREPPSEPPPEMPSGTDVLIAEAQVDLLRLRGLPPAGLRAAIDGYAPLGEPAYATLMRDTGPYEGSRACYAGTVRAFERDGEGLTLRVATRAGGRDVLWVEAVLLPETEVEVGTEVRACGRILGTYSDGEVTMPVLLAVAVAPR